MVVHIVHRRTTRKPEPGCSLLPNEEGLLHSDEMLPVEETIHMVHGDETSARNECAALNKATVEDQVKHYGEVLDQQA